MDDEARVIIVHREYGSELIYWREQKDTVINDDARKETEDWKFEEHLLDAIYTSIHAIDGVSSSPSQSGIFFQSQRLRKTTSCT